MMLIDDLVTRRNLPIRMLLLIAVCVPIAFAPDFYDHFHAYLTGNVLGKVVRRRWDIVLLSILLFLACLVPLSFRRKAKWVEYGLVTGFFVSLFVEMYGVPFTILLAQRWLHQPGVIHPVSVIDFHLLGVHFGMDLPMAYGAVLMGIGGLLITVGWISLYYGVKTRELVTDGIYAVSRHPQYLGFIMIVAGWFIGWPTLVTVVMAPILILKYIRLARHEETEAESVADYHLYRDRVPFLI